MPYNTKAIKVDVNAKPVPQYFNPTLDDYEALYGANGAMRVLLYDANGNPLLTEPNPGYIRAADGAIATLGAKADAAVTDPTLSASEIALLKGLLKQLQGGGMGSLPVSLNGSKTSLTSLLTNTPLAAGASFAQNTVDAESEGIVATSLLVYPPDTVTEVALQVGADGVNFSEILRLPLFRNRRTVIPPIWIPTRYYRWVIRNRTQVAQTALRVDETRHFVYVRQPKSVPVVLIDAFMPTADRFMDTTTDSNRLFSVRLSAAGDGPKPIFISNTTDQEQLVYVNLLIASASGVLGQDGTYTDGTYSDFDTGDLVAGFSVAAHTKLLWTNKEYPGLDVPMMDLRMAVNAKTATTGKISAYTIVFVG